MKSRIFYLASFAVVALALSLTVGAFWHDIVQADKAVSQKGRAALRIKPGESLQSSLWNRLTSSP